MEMLKRVKFDMWKEILRDEYIGDLFFTNRNYQSSC